MKDYNISPYYDDFDSTKNYHRILFKPGGAVQARELTQSQTILQDQISKFGLGIYQDGSKVSGGNITIDTQIVTAKLISNANNVSSFVDLFAVGSTSKFISQVVEVDVSNKYLITKPVNVENNSSFASGETIKLYSSKAQALNSLNSAVTEKYVSQIKTESYVLVNATGEQYDDSLIMQTVNLSVGDELYISTINFRSTIVSISSDGNSITVDKPLPQSITSASANVTNKISVNATEFNIDDGVWFTNGFFVSNYNSSIIPDALSVYPSVVVGFELLESTVTYLNDDSLLDPAIGASNYQAPGADRYCLQLNLTTKPYIDEQTVGNLTTNKFIELARINKGIVESVNKTPIFPEISKSIAQSVYDQSGDFIVNPFSLSIGNSSANNANIVSHISAGKAYISGYPVEHTAPTKYVLEKARDYTSEENVDVNSYYGSYLKIKDISGTVPSFSTGEIIDLRNSSNIIIGKSRVRNFAFEGDTSLSSNTASKIFLYDVSITNSSFTIANVSSVSSNTTSFVANVNNTLNSTVLYDGSYDSLVFPLDQINIKEVTNVNYVTTRRHTATFSAGVATLSCGSNEDFLSAGSASLRQRYYTIVLSSGQFVDMSWSNVSITTGSHSVTLNYASYGGTATVYSTISVTNDQRKVKSSSNNVAVLVNADANTPIDLGVSDIYKFHGVYEIGASKPYRGSWNSGTSYTTNQSVLQGNTVYYATTSSLNQNPVTNTSAWSVVTNGAGTNFTTDSGQRDTHYDHGYITNISGVAKSNVVAVFDYFTHSGGSGYFDVNSYNSINYNEIPSFTSQQYGTTYSLRDVIDFRPRRTDGATTFNSFQLPAPFNNAFVDYSYYLSRIDKIAMFPNGQFKTIRGISSYLNPIEPVDLPGALTLFTLNYAPYTFSRDDITVVPTNLRRYTMRDIGILDKRITNLEYYTTLSLSENEVSGGDITDASNGQLLFKNGFLVDGFKGHGVGDVNNPDYKASIDFTSKYCRPLFSSTVPSLFVNPTQGVFSTTSKTNNQLVLKDNLVMFTYDETPFITQTIASDYINVNPFNVINFVGEFKLSPSSDVWYDTVNKPVVNIINEDQAAWQAAVNGSGNGTQWNDWNINWTGQSVVDPNNQDQISRDTKAIQDTITQKGLSGALTGGNIQVSSTTQILSNAIIPYCRSVPVRFDLRGMPPYTELYAFMNGVLVNPYIAPDAPSTDGVWYVEITNAGTLYADQPNVLVTVSGNNTISANVTANIVGGKVVSVDVIQAGAGYQTVPTLSLQSSTSGTPAVLTVKNTTGQVGAQLKTDVNGKASGTIYIPNDDIAKITTGTIFVEFSDQPHISAINGAYASGSFFAQGTLQTLQTTVVSTRPPSYISKTLPYVPEMDGGSSNEYWSTDALQPDAPTLTYDEVKTSVYNYLIARAQSPNTAITPFRVNKFWNAGGFDTIYTQLKTSFGTNPTVAMAAGYSLKSIQIDTQSNELSASGAIGRVVTIIINTAKRTSQNIPLVDANQTKRILNNAKNTKIAKKTCLMGKDPVSQNFYVIPDEYPNGLFVSSVDLFFVSKDDLAEVNVRIRPTVNGFPDSENDIPGSIVYKNPSEVNVPDAANRKNSIGPSTTFTFDHPIYLAPGEYSLMIMSNSNGYQVYESKRGQIEFPVTDGKQTITGPTYAGSFFKSQNSTTWVPSSEGETLCFVLRRCDFAGGTASFQATSNTSSSATYFDVAQVTSNDLSFVGSDTIDYQITTKDATSSATNQITIIPNDNINFATRQIQNAASDIIITPTLNNINRFTSPVVDLERLNAILVKNIVSSSSVANTASESLGGLLKGNAVAKYITRRVTLNKNFDATGLTVYVDVQRPLGTSIEVFYKVLNSVDQNNFDNQPYVKMNAVFAPGGSVQYTTTSSWTSDTYQMNDITYPDLTTNVVYSDFRTFAIKVVFYSDNPALVPKIKNFRAIATVKQ